jgi:hypothetical protein
MVILLVLLAGKYRDTIQVIPSVIGFFMYQVRPQITLHINVCMSTG